MQELSRMQQKIYDYIAAFIQEKGYPPSVREIGDAVGLKSPSTVHFHLKHLEEAGVIEKTANKGRAIVLSHRGERQAAHVPSSQPSRMPKTPQQEAPRDRVPIVGNVAAGSPILAEECVEDYLTLDVGGRNSAGRLGGGPPAGGGPQRGDRGGPSGG